MILHPHIAPSSETLVPVERERERERERESITLISKIIFLKIFFGDFVTNEVAFVVRACEKKFQIFSGDIYL